MFTASRRWNPHMLARSSSWMTSWSWIGASVFCRWKYDNWLAIWELSRRIPACGKHVTRAFRLWRRKIVSLLNVLEIEPKGTSPILPVDKNLKDDSEKTWGQIVLWSPPNKHGTTCRMLQWQSLWRGWDLQNKVFSDLFFHLCFSDFFRWTSHRFLQGPGGFLDLAVEHACSAAAAACAAAAAASRTLPAPAKRKLLCCRLSWKAQEEKAEDSISRRPMRWEVVEARLSKDPLQDFWDKDMAKGLHMTPKCFASRIYHKIDKNSRTRAKKAHAAAMQFALGQSEWMGLVYRCLIGGFWDAHASLMGSLRVWWPSVPRWTEARWYGWKKKAGSHMFALFLTRFFQQHLLKTCRGWLPVCPCDFFLQILAQTRLATRQPFLCNGFSNPSTS